MLSTRFDMQHRPGDGELQLTDLLARQATNYLERKMRLAHCSRDPRYVWANPAYAELAGVPLEYIVGRPMVELTRE